MQLCVGGFGIGGFDVEEYQVGICYDGGIGVGFDGEGFIESFCFQLQVFGIECFYVLWLVYEYYFVFCLCQYFGEIIFYGICVYYGNFYVCFFVW